MCSADSFVLVWPVRSPVTLVDLQTVTCLHENIDDASRLSEASALLQELTAQCSILSHPNVLRYLGTYETAGLPRYAVIENISGTLREHLSKAPPLSCRRLCCILSDVLAALAYLHTCRPIVVLGEVSLDTLFVQVIASNVIVVKVDVAMFSLLRFERGLEDAGQASPARDLRGLAHALLEIVLRYLDIPDRLRSERDAAAALFDSSGFPAAAPAACALLSKCARNLGFVVNQMCSDDSLSAHVALQCIQDVLEMLPVDAEARSDASPGMPALPSVSTTVPASSSVATPALAAGMAAPAPAIKTAAATKRIRAKYRFDAATHSTQIKLGDAPWTVSFCIGRHAGGGACNKQLQGDAVPARIATGELKSVPYCFDCFKPT